MTRQIVNEDGAAHWPPIGETSQETEAVCDVLSGMEVGALVPYAKLTEVAGGDVTGESRHIMDSARRICIREHGIVFEAVRGIGLRRMEDSQLAHLGAPMRMRVRRLARRTVSKVRCAKYDRLGNDDKTAHNTALSVAGLLVLAASDRARKKIEARVTDGALPSRESLKVLG